MRTQDIAKLAAALAAGDITADAIKEQLGDGVLESVLAFGGGIIGGAAVGGLASAGIDAIEEATGLFSAADDLIGGLFD
jgi:hypothetical protein